MVYIVLLCSGLLAAGPPHSTPSDDDLQTYRAAQVQAGRDADAHVRLALWCEAHGLQAERLKHLAIAVVTNPAHAAARGLMGLVADGGQWLRPEAVAERVRADAERAAQRAEYNSRTARAQDTAPSQWDLALWCEQQGLKAEAMAHFTAVTRLDPNREAAWTHLGCRKHNGRWITAEQIAAEEAEIQAQQQADRRWRPLLEKWRSALDDKGRRDEAAAALAEVTDPRAVPTIWKVFAQSTPGRQDRAVQLLGQVAAPTSSRALAALAVSGKTAEVRRAAAETLLRRDPRDFVAALIGLLRAPIRYEVRAVGGPGSPGALFVEGRRFNRQLIYSPPPAPEVALLPGDSLSYDAFGLPVIHRYLGSRTVQYNDVQNQQAPSPTIADLANAARGQFGQLAAQTLTNAQAGAPSVASQPIAPAPQRRNVTVTATIPSEAQIPVGQMIVEARRTALVAQQQLQNDVAQIERFNRRIHEANRRVLGVLTPTTSQDLGEDPTAWNAWWTDQIGYSYTPSPTIPRPTFVQQVPLAYQPRQVPVTVLDGPSVTVDVRDRIGHSCFGAGTLVRTQEGLRPIEEIRAGDQVLTQDTASGALSYQPVLAIYHNPPNRTLRITLDDEAILVTPIHRFWRAGRGWAMARDLKPGDTLRTLGGLEQVTAVESDAVQPVFNLEVARGRSFFVGQAGTLVHDNSLVEPTPEPFDAGPVLAVAEGDRVE